MSDTLFDSCNSLAKKHRMWVVPNRKDSGTEYTIMSFHGMVLVYNDLAQVHCFLYGWHLGAQERSQILDRITA